MDSDCGPGRHLTSSGKRAKNLKLLLCALVPGVYFAGGRETEGGRPVTAVRKIVAMK